MSNREASVVSAVSVVAVAAILGGAFYPGPRVVVGVLLAVMLGWTAAAMRRGLGAEEWTVFGFIVWSVVAAAVAASAPLAAREVVVVWIVTWGLWLTARRAGEWSSRAGLLVLAAAAVILALGVVLEAVGVGGRGRAGRCIPNVLTSRPVSSPSTSTG